MILTAIILCCVLLTAKCFKDSTTEIHEDSKSPYGEKYSDEYLLFDENYDDSMFFNQVDPMMETREAEPEDTEELNCFGIGGKLSSVLDYFLTNDANSTETLKALFYATSRQQPERVTMQHNDVNLLEKLDFNIRRRTVFIVHGFLADGDTDWVIEMQRALLKWDDVNVFVVDWSNGASTWNYFKAAVNTRTVGNQLATFIGRLINQVELWYGPNSSEWGPLHLIGHSLGAHICGHAAYELKRRNSQWPVRRITGLDPAQPCFRHSDLSLRLDRSDAEFVDVIHTNGGILKKLRLGLPNPSGDVDFYPNGGSIQPGCILMKSSLWEYLPLPIEKIESTICSHGRSHSYLTGSIIVAAEKNCTFWAREWDMKYTSLEKILAIKCENNEANGRCTEMGINAEKYNNHDAVYFSMTGSSAPYCTVDAPSVDNFKKFLVQLKQSVFLEDT